MADVASGGPGWQLDGPRVQIGSNLRVSFQRTPRIPGGQVVAPPTSYGAAPLWPAHATDADVLVAIGDDEAFWIGFSAIGDTPVATRVLVEAPKRIDALTGATPEDRLSREPQNYLVCPLQSAVDGIRSDAEHVVQFVRGGTDAGVGACERLTIVALLLKTPRPRAPAPPETRPRPMASAGTTKGAPVRQAVLGDPYGIDKWQEGGGTAVHFRLVSHAEYVRVSGEPAPPPLDQVSVYRGRRFP